jgi:hypothetical protein
MHSILLLLYAIAGAAPAVDVGLRKQLMVDDLVVAESRNLTRVVGTVTKANSGQPLRFSRHDTAGRALPIDVWPAFATVYYDASLKKFRMWYRISFDDTSRKGTTERASATALGVGTGYHRAYAESSDGLHFEFVALLEGLATSGDTNMVVTIDDHETDAEHRYKIGYDTDGPVHAAGLAHSRDGIHWTPYNGGRPVTYRASDFTNQVIWDPAIRAYRLFTRTDFGDGGGPLAGSVKVPVGAKMLEVRGVRSMTNPDIKANPEAWTLERHWLLDGEEEHPRNRPPIEELLKDPAYLERLRREALRRQIYMLTDWPYEGVHFGLMPVLEYPTDVSEGTSTDQVTRHERSVENYYFVTSRDGVTWNYRWVYAGKPLVPRGPTAAWDKDMVFPTAQIVTHQDKHWIYYGANNERHGCAEKNVWFGRQGSIGLAWLRLDGFVAMSAGSTPGTLTTKPFKLEGSKLELNAVVDRKGSLRVEVLDTAGNPIPGYSGKSSPQFSGVDNLRFAPTWNGQRSLASLQGQAVQLRIHLQDAQLYAFQVRP